MTLTEFLVTANVDDTIALAEAKAYTTTKVWRIEGQIRKTAVETVFTNSEIEERLQGFVEDISLIDVGARTSTQATTLKVSKAILRSISRLYEPEYYINLADPDIATMFAAADALDILEPTEIEGITRAATYTETPFVNTTLAQIKAIRYPPTWIGCEHGGQSYMVSASNADMVTLSVELVDNVNNVTVRCYWATAVGQQEYLSNRTLSVNGSDALNVSQSFSRAEIGLPTTARILRFEYTSVYDGVVNSVHVSK